MGKVAAARKLVTAVEAVTADDPHTPYLWGKATAAEVTQAVCGRIRG